MLKDSSEITIVIPNYNGMKFLPACMESLQAQEDAPSYDILIVDNGSSDESVSFLRENYPEVRLITLPENTGFCHAVNVGIREAKAPYVILLNNDTKVDAHFVGALYHTICEEEDSKELAKTPESTVTPESLGTEFAGGLAARSRWRKNRIFSVSAQMQMWDNPQLLDDAGDQYTVLGWAYGRGKGKPAICYEKPANVFAACGGAAIYRKEVFEKIGLFDEAHFAYLEDLDIGYRARIHGYKNLYEPSAKVIHYGSASSGSRYNPFKTELAAANNVYVVWKNMPLLQLVWNLPFLLVGFFVKFLFFCKKGMGRLYLKGIGKGFRKCASKQGRLAKVPFSWRHLGNYLKLQGLLYKNTILFLKKN